MTLATKLKKSLDLSRQLKQEYEKGFELGKNITNISHLSEIIKSSRNIQLINDEDESMDKSLLAFYNIIYDNNNIHNNINNCKNDNNNNNNNNSFPIIDINPEKFFLLKGYSQGLKKIKGINNIGHIDFSDENFLNSFFNGLNLESPGLPRIYNLDFTKKNKDSKNSQNNRGELSMPKLYEFVLDGNEQKPPEILENHPIHHNSINGYRLGFILALHKRYDFPVIEYGIPLDDMSYHAFLDGLNLKPRPLDYNNNDMYHSHLDNKCYKTGLTAWLKQNNYDQIKASVIRDPEKLQEFKKNIKKIK